MIPIAGRKRSLVFAALAFLASTVAAAQESGNIAGIVQDALTDTPLVLPCPVWAYARGIAVRSATNCAATLGMDVYFARGRREEQNDHDSNPGSNSEEALA